MADGLAEFRECTVCGRLLPLGMFHKNGAGYMGRSGMCAECDNLASLEARNIRKMKKKMAKYHSEALDEAIKDAAKRGMSYGKLKAERRRADERKQQE